LMRSSCLATSLGMPGMSEDFQAKASRLACRKSTSALSYLVGSWVLICTVLAGSLGSTSISLVSSIGRKALDGVKSLRSEHLPPPSHGAF
jgi:hypothetical protein